MKDNNTIIEVLSFYAKTYSWDHNENKINAEKRLEAFLRDCDNCQSQQQMIKNK